MTPGADDSTAVGPIRRRLAVSAIAGGAAGIPAGFVIDDSLVMITGLCVLWLAAGLWNPEPPPNAAD